MEFRLLGPLEARSDGRSLPLGGSKQRALLAMLLLHPNEVVSTDRLIDELWGARPPKAVQGSIQNCVSRLRAVLGHELIETRPPGYLLNVEVTGVDAFRFERALAAARDLDPPERAAALREALALWRGAPLADLAFEGFVQSEISRLDELRLVALELRLDAELELGHHDAVLGEIEALARRHPARERLRYLQMLALYRAGRQRDALRAYQEARLELVEEYGLEPSEDLRALERMIIAHDPALHVAAATADEPSRHRLRRNVVVVMMEIVGENGSDVVSREATAASLAEIAMVVERHEGSVRQLLPEELVAVFGEPVMHDDDTLRALRAAVESRAVVSSGLAVRTAVERLGGGNDGSTELDAVRRLLAHAGAGDLLLGPEALRLVPTAVDVVRHEASEGYRVLRFDPAADPFARHLDAPLVGRSAELEQLDAALRDVVRTGSPRRVVLLGEAGIGKTRLAQELVARVGPQAKALTARCRAYGDGAALLPVLELLEQIGPVQSVAPVVAGERDADSIITRLREQSLSEPTEGFWALRRLLEAAAADGPLILVLEDVHLAAPTFFDLVEYIRGWAAAPLLLLCLARPELLEQRPDWRDDAVFLEPMPVADAEQLVAALPESAGLEPTVVAAAVAAAEGNPLFLEQLVSFAAEDAAGSLPPTLEVLIASRVDRLPPDERAMLQRAAVAGRHFWRSTVEAATPDDERAAVGGALMALVRRRLVHPERALLPGEDGFRFHHALIRDAVYAGVPEPMRAELHESVARSLDGHTPDFDEIVGYHLEQAAILGSSTQLAEEAARRLGAAGVRALSRIDGRAAIDLLTRAIALARADGELKLEFECALGMALKASGDRVGAEALLDDVAQRSAGAGNTRTEYLARIEQVWPRLERGELAVDEVLELLDRARAVFEEVGDDFALGRAWNHTASVTAVYKYRYDDLEAAAAHTRHYFERSGIPTGVVVFMLAVAAYRGPTPVREGIERCQAQLREAAGPLWESFVLPPLAALEAMDGRFDEARAHLTEARLARQEFADTASLVTSWSAFAAEVELLAANPEQAEEILSVACDALRPGGPIEWLATNTALLAEAMYRQGRFVEALSASGSALAVAPPGHLTSRAIARRVHAKALARAQRFREARFLADETIELLASTDVLDEQGEALATSAEIHELGGAVDEARSAWEAAVAVFERKGNVVSAARVRRSLAALS